MKKFKRIIVVIFIFIISNLLHADNLSVKRQKIANQLAEISQIGGDRIGYSEEILHHLAKVYRIYPENLPQYRGSSYRYRRSRRREHQVDTYSLLTGGLAIRESLQLDSIAPVDYSNSTVKLSTLKGSQVKSHPFEEMLKGRTYKMFDLAKYCPENFYYFHFNNLTNALEFFDYLGSVGGSIHKKFSPISIDYMLKEKILKQLALRENKLARKFYNYVIDEISIVGSDPFIMEGTDVSIICKLSTPSVFNTTINKYRKYYKKKFKAKTKNIKINGYKTKYLYTNDKKINSYLTTLDKNTVVISNSKSAVKTIINVINNKHNSLAKANDFKYMRSVYPANQKLEDGFLYLSDAFIRYLISPELRIKEARRLSEAARISVFEKYILYYYQLNNKFPNSINDIVNVIKAPPLTKVQKALIKKIENHQYYKFTIASRMYSTSSWYRYKRSLKRKLQKENSKDKDLNKKVDKYINELKESYRKIQKEYPGSPRDVFNLVNKKPDKDYSKLFKNLKLNKNKFFATSKLYGRQGTFKPNLETKLEFISEQEVREYNKFLRDYNNYWKDYFDPIGVRIKLKDGIKVETCILPLINNSIYNVLTNFIGGSPVVLHPNNNIEGEIFSLSLKLNKNNMLRDRNVNLLNKFLQADPDMAGVSVFDLFHDEMQIHLLDTRPLVDFDGKQIFSSLLRSRLNRYEVYAGFLAWSLFHPIRVSYPVKDTRVAKKALNAIEKFYTKKSQQMYSRDYSLSNYSYKYKSNKISVLKLTFFRTLKFRIYYTITNNALEISTTQHYIESIIDKTKPAKKNGFSESKGNIIAVYRPKQMILEKSLYKFSMLESAQESSFNNFGTFKLLSTIFPKKKNLDEVALNIFGFKPVCPMGGKYLIDAKTKQVSNTVFGNRNKTIIDVNKIKSDSLKRYFSTDEIKIELEFTKEGIKTVLTTK